MNLWVAYAIKLLTGLTLFRLGGGAQYRFLPCSAKTVCSRLMKLSDF